MLSRAADLFEQVGERYYEAHTLSRLGDVQRAGATRPPPACRGGGRHLRRVGAPGPGPGPVETARVRELTAGRPGGDTVAPRRLVYQPV
ncbi:hypothetical protein [Acrocarpospora macrocephala]|uniref:hypothetical protein n=1 Tax=Acrocarpospora macrocephala TaxID=150177 RepID=UPI0012D309B1|nr:hypothetical protein [Acrocarpospora macrocephala]